LERNNMFEGYYSPPLLNDLYNFRDGAQNDIFEGDYNTTTPTPSSSNHASRDMVHAEEQAERRAWGAHHRRSIDNYHP
jgi:hypothetical protein